MQGDSLMCYPLGVRLQKPGSEEQFDPSSELHTFLASEHW